MRDLKFSAGLWVYGPVPDRYLPTGYQQTEEIEKRIARASQTKGIAGVEMPYGPVVTLKNVDQLKKMVTGFGLSVSSVAANVTGDRKWALGSLSNPNRETRKEAINLIKDSMCAATIMGAETVNLWMGQDGFDYPFEADYSDIWSYIVDGLRECAESCPEIKLCLEYKCMEPRAKCIPNSAAQSLLLVNEAKAENLGVTLDFGHALLGGENPSQSALMLNTYGKLTHVHMNDNYADWDWDMAAGVNHWWQLVEFCYWLNEISFSNWLVLDIFPYRHSPEKVSELSVKAIRKAFETAERLDKEKISSAFENRSAIDVFSSLLE